VNTFSHLHLAEFLVEPEMFQIKVVEKIKIHILCPINFPPENRAVNEGCGGARGAAIDNTVTRCMLD
jgi:hypothetical protein